MSRRAKTIRIDHQAAATALRDQPGTWQVVGDYRNRISADGLVAAIRFGRTLGSGRGHAPYAPAGAFETRIELVEDGTRIHARYVGEETAR